MSLWTLVAVGGSALGALGLGALIDLAGARPALTGAALAGLAAVALLVARPLAAAARPTPSVDGVQTDAPELRTEERDGITRVWLVVPHGPSDQRLDWIVTEETALRLAPKPQRGEPLP